MSASVPPIGSNHRTKGKVCSPKTMKQFNKIAEQALDNLQEQVLYK